MQFDVAVPATLSNLGPGFDVLGMAVSIYNRFEFRVLDDLGRFEAYGAPVKPSAHLSLRTLLAAQRLFGGELPGGIAVEQEEDVPRSRGLGSSATARVAGYVAFTRLTGVEPPLADALAFLAEAEGHPDNAVPAMVGGLTICADDDGALRHLRFEPPTGLRIALCIPERTVETAAARKAMPQSYSRDDAVFNTSRIAFLLAGLIGGQTDALTLGAQDRIHQPYRKGLIGPVDEALNAATEAGASAAFISGSGSTLAAFVLDPDTNLQRITEAMSEPFAEVGIGCVRRTAEPANRGAA